MPPKRDSSLTNYLRHARLYALPVVQYWVGCTPNFLAAWLTSPLSFFPQLDVVVPPNKPKATDVMHVILMLNEQQKICE